MAAGREWLTEIRLLVVIKITLIKYKEVSMQLKDDIISTVFCLVPFIVLIKITSIYKEVILILLLIVVALLLSISVLSLLFDINDKAGHKNETHYHRRK